MFEMLDHNGACHFGSSFALGSLNPICVKKNEFEHPRTNPDQAMASSATSATSFELIEDQTLTAEEVEMASQEAQEIRTREAAVAAGLVLDEPEDPVGFGYRRDEGPLQCTGASPCGVCHTDFRLGCPWPRRGGGQGHGRCGRHAAGYSTGGGTDTTHEEAEGFRGGFPEDHGSCEQTGAGGGPTRLLQAGGPPRPFPGPSGIGGHVAEGRHCGGGGLPVPQVCREESHGGPGDSYPGGLCPDEDPDPAGGGLGLTVPEEQGVHWHPANAQT